jgi:hypothetical protein
MRTLALRYCLLTVVAGALLAGCSGSAPQAGIPGAIPQSRAIAVRGDRGRSWMLPEAKSENLMYVSDIGEGVFVYDYQRPRFKFVGLLVGLSDPEGECVDKAQDIYVANTSANGGGEVLEYRHGGTTPINILAVDGYPKTCAVDLTTGNLAVIAFNEQERGFLAIFKKARGKPVVYSDSGFDIYAGAYDPKGDLFLDGSVESSGVQIAEIPEGSTQFKSIALSQTPSEVGSLQWAGKHLAVGDAYEAVIYQFDIAGSKGTEVGSTPLSDSPTLIAQFFIAGDRVIVPSETGDYGGYVKIYDYPAGGKATRTLSNLSIPDSVVVSYAQK